MPVPVGWDVSRAAELYREGVSLEELAARLGVAKSAVRRQLVKAGVEMRPKFRPPLGHVDTDYVIFLREVKQLTWRDIGERVGMSTQGAQSRYLAGVRQSEAVQRPHRWSELLIRALENEPGIEVAAVVQNYLGRVPTRSEITAARRAASRLVQSGIARRLEPRSPLLLARADATEEQMNTLVAARARQRAEGS